MRTGSTNTTAAREARLDENSLTGAPADWGIRDTSLLIEMPEVCITRVDRAVAEHMAERLLGAQTQLAAKVKDALRATLQIVLSNEAPCSISARSGIRICMTRLAGTARRPQLVHVVLDPQDSGGHGLTDPVWLTARFVYPGSNTMAWVADPTEGAGHLACDLRGLDAQEALILKGVSLRGADLTQARLAKTQFVNCNLGGASLRHADLREVAFHRTSLRGANLSASNLAEAQFIGCSMSGVRLTGCHLHAATFYACQMLGADLQASSIESAMVTRCLVGPSTALPAALVPQNLKQPTDIIHPGDIVIYPSTAPGFVRQFVDLLPSLGASAWPVKGEVDWLRDNWFKGKVEGDSFKLFAAPQDVRTLRQGSGWMLMHQWHSRFGTPINPWTTPVTPDARASLNYVVFPATDLEFSLTSGQGITPGPFVAGGNSIVVEDLCILGNDSLLYAPRDVDSPQVTDAKLRKAAERYPGITDMSMLAHLQVARARAKTDLAALMGPIKVCVMGQIFFHIDMQMSALGRNVILMHSFSATAALLNNHFGEFERELHGEAKVSTLIADNSRLADRYEPMIEENCAKLRKQGLTVVLASAMIISDVKDELPVGVHSLFSNGITFDPGGRSRRTYFTAGARTMRTHMGYFADVCDKLDVSVQFLMGRSGEVDPATYIEKNDGGLRCMINTNTVALLGHVPTAAKDPSTYV